MASALQEQEKAVGITAFVSPDAPGFACTIKHRYTDFLVNEILPDGNVLHLVNDRVVKRQQDGHEQERQIQDARVDDRGSQDADHRANSPIQSTEKRKREEGRDELGDRELSLSKKPRINGEDTIGPKASVEVEPAKPAHVPANTDRTAEIISSFPEQDRSTLMEIFREQTTDRILALHATVLQYPDRKSPSVVSEMIAEESERTEAHEVIRQMFASKLSVETMGQNRSQLRIRAAQKAPVKQQTGGAEEETGKSRAAIETIASVPESDKDILRHIFGQNVTIQILDLYASVLVHPLLKPRKHKTVLSDIITEKTTRTEAHGAIRRIFGSKLLTETMQDKPGQMRIAAAPTKGPSGARAQAGNDSNGAINKGKLAWEDLGGEYLHFTLYKENKDTMEVLHFMATQLKVPAKNFQFAGTKDRRGVTTQRVAIYRLHADRLQYMNRMLRGSRLGDFEYKKHGLDLGESNGNEFLLTLRDVHVSGEGLTHEQRLDSTRKAVAQAAISFSQHGFLNYYGLQRFGTYNTGTHETGRRMLKGDLEGAIDAILAYSNDLLPENVDTSETARVPQDDINRAHAIRLFRDTGRSDAVDKMPRRFQAEGAIIQYLSRKDRKSGKRLQEKDWQGALMQIQRNLRLMYVHAYQSFVWNAAAGRRWDLYGGKVVEGDLVIVGEKDVEQPAKQEMDDDGEVVFHPAADDSAPNAEDTFTRARHLSKGEAESGKYDIFDIVLPLPGYDVSYPANEVGKFYQEFMGSEAGGGLDPHSMRRSWKDVSLSGDYRKVLARPGKGFGFEVKSYVSDEEQMIETDLEKLNKRANTNADSAAIASTGVKGDEQEEGEAATHYRDQKIAVVLKMQLGSSQYATMALRELTKGGAINYKPDFSSR